MLISRDELLLGDILLGSHSHVPPDVGWMVFRFEFRRVIRSSDSPKQDFCQLMGQRLSQRLVLVSTAFTWNFSVLIRARKTTPLLRTMKLTRLCFQNTWGAFFYYMTQLGEGEFESCVKIIKLNYL